MSRKLDPLVSATDRMAAATLQVDRLCRFINTRTRQRADAIPEEPAWDHRCASDAGIRSEAASLFPGPRSAWVR